MKLSKIKSLLNKYLVMVIVGIILTLCLLFKLCNNLPNWELLTFDILAMLGSGVLCSAIVSWIIDIQTKKEAEKIREEQMNFILRSVKRNIVYLLKAELKNLSFYHNKYILKEEKKGTKTPLPLSEINERIIRLTNEIKKTEEKILATKEVSYLTPMDCKREDDKYKFLAKNPRLYYEILHEKFESITNESNFYFINKVFNEKEVELFEALIWDIRDILSNSTKNDLFDESLFEFKLTLYEKIANIITLLKIKDEIEDVYLYY